MDKSLTQPTVYTCKRCGFVTDISAAMREHHLRQMSGWDTCKPKGK